MSNVVNNRLMDVDEPNWTRAYSVTGILGLIHDKLWSLLFSLYVLLCQQKTGLHYETKQRRIP